jgi:DNA-binding protein HU-beta
MVISRAAIDSGCPGERGITGRRAAPESGVINHKREPMPVVTLKHISAGIAEKQELPKKQVLELLEGFVDALTKNLKKGEKIRVPGLGIFVVAKRAARMGRNPATGEPIKIKASKKVRFRPSKELKEAVM